MRRILFLSVIYFITTASLFAQVDYDGPQTYKIAGINIEGAEFTDKTSVMLYSGLTPGDEVTIPGPEITEAVKKLWKQGVYSDIEISIDNIAGDKIYLNVRVGERPRIARFAFKGVTNSQANDIREKIMFIRGTIWTQEKERRAKRIIRNYFIEKGFYATQVNINADEYAYMENGVEIRIAVDKGRRIKINKIRIEGNQEFADAKLKRKMKEIKEKAFWRVWARSKYLPKKFEESKDNLVAFYNENGYRNMRIVSDTIYNVDNRNVEVSMNIFEGDQFFFRDITWVGNYKYSDDTLTQVLGIRKGDSYNSTLLQQRLSGDPNQQDVSSLYLDDGYLFYNADPVEILVEGDSIDLEMRMNEGPQATIRKIIIEGNTKTSDYVILRELRTVPGQKFSRADLIRSQREILNLGYFNQETLNVLPIPDPANGTVDIKYVVEEKPSDQLQVQGGWGGRVRDPITNEVIGGGFVGTVNLAFNNFSTKRFFKKEAWNPVPSGDGQKLSLAVQMNGVGWQNYSVSFLEPWLGGKKPNSLGASVYYSVNSSRNTNFRMNTLGSSVDFGKRMKFPDDFFRSFTSLGYKFYDIQNGTSFLRDLGFDNGSVNIISLTQTFDRTNLDAPMFPRSGAAINFAVSATPPYSLFPGRKSAYQDATSEAEKFQAMYKLLEYHKWTFSATWYKQVWKDLVIRPKIQMGYLGTYSKDYILSPFERFNLGGSGFGAFNFFGQDFVSLRGYQNNSVGPVVQSDDGTRNLVGGAIYNKYSLELRYPINLSEAAPIWVLGFMEAGNSWLNFKDYKPFELKRSMGLGIRVVLPMVGLLGVDWAWGFDNANALNPALRSGSQFHFVIGQEF